MHTTLNTNQRHARPAEPFRSSGRLFPGLRGPSWPYNTSTAAEEKWQCLARLATRPTPAKYSTTWYGLSSCLGRSSHHTRRMRKITTCRISGKNRRRAIPVSSQPFDMNSKLLETKRPWEFSSQSISSERCRNVRATWLNKWGTIDIKSYAPWFIESILVIPCLILERCFSYICYTLST